jgi:thiamine pyrophosphate-dependent acetolactate synthase large subunit-like protein
VAAVPADRSCVAPTQQATFDVPSALFSRTDHDPPVAANRGSVVHPTDRRRFDVLFHHVIAKALTDHDVDTVFGLMGDGNLYMMESFVRTQGKTFVPVTHEANSVLAALGYARVTGRLGVASVTHGPALTNTVTALVEGSRARLPVVLVAGETAATDRHHSQNIEQRAVVEATGAGFEPVRSPDTVCQDLAIAVRRAHVERRPIVLDVPIEFQWQETEYVAVEPWVPPAPAAPHPDALDAALGVIASARRPVVLAGSGAASPAAGDALRALAQRIGAPVATTLLARDLFRGDPHDLGVFGTLSHEIALKTISDADCVLTFGAALTRNTTAEGSLLDGKAVVQIDDDPSAFGRFRTPTVAVLADAAEAAEQFTRQLEAAGVPTTGFASQALAEALAARTEGGYRDASTDTTVDLRTAAIRLDKALPRDRVVVSDAGRFLYDCYTALHVEVPTDYVHMVAFGSIGLGIGGAIGAATGSGKPTLLIAGDGGWMMNGFNEFVTAVHQGLDLVVAVFNDGAYGAEYVQFVRKGMDPTPSVHAWPDLAPVAESLGGTGYTVRSLADLDTALAALPQRRGPVLLDIKLDPAVVGVQRG